MNTTELDPFEERLLARLRANVGATAKAPDAVPSRRLAFSPRRMALAGVAATVGAVVIWGATLGSNTSPAFAIDPQPDGFLIRINTFEDADKLEAALADMGIRADITYTEVGYECEERVTEGVPEGGPEISGITITDAERNGETDGSHIAFEFEVDKSLVNSPYTLVVETSWDEKTATLDSYITGGEIPACVVTKVK